jgi:transposase
LPVIRVRPSRKRTELNHLSEFRGPSQRAASAARCSGRWRLRIVRRAEASRGFVVLPKRWIVERTLAWLTRCRRLARNLENLARTSVALIRLAMIKLMARRLARS